MVSPNAQRLGIPTRPQVLTIAVCTPTSTVKTYCKLQFQVCGKAMVYTNGWSEAVKAFNLHEDDVCLFRFKDDRMLPKSSRDPLAWLRMEIIKIREDCGRSLHFGVCECYDF